MLFGLWFLLHVTHDEYGVDVNSPRKRMWQVKRLVQSE